MPRFKVWSLFLGKWSPLACETLEEVRAARRFSAAVGASHTIVSVPGEPEYDGDMGIVNGHIACGRM